MNDYRTIPVIILAGGLGVRLRSVLKDVPKLLAPIGKGAMLDLVIDSLLRQGFTDILVSIGYQKSLIKKHVSGFRLPPGVTIRFSEEHEPLGTGGAIKHAMLNEGIDDFFVVNGDTYFPVNFKEIEHVHRESTASITMALREVSEGGRYGNVIIGTDRRITGFSEKCVGGGPSLVSGGIYRMHRSALMHASYPSSFSIERDVFEKQFNTLKMLGVVFSDYFIDIGTPEDYEKAKKVFQDFRGLRE